MSDAGFESPLAHRLPIAAGSGSTLAISEIVDRGAIDLRLRPDDAEAMRAAADCLGLPLPTAPRTSAHSGDLTVLWWSPDQWLITCPRTEAGTLAVRLAAALAGRHAMVNDVSDARAVIRLHGPDAREAVMKGTSIDLLGREVGAGFVRRAQLAELPVAVHIVDTEAELVDVYVFRSYADYVWSWLARAARPAATVGLFRQQAQPPV